MGGLTFRPEGQISDCLVTGGLDTVRSHQETGSSQPCIVLLSTVGNVVLEKMCKAFGELE